MLARIPEELAKQRDAHFNKLTRDKQEAVDNEPLKDQHPSMPMSTQRRTTYSFGGGKKELFFSKLSELTLTRLQVKM